MSQARDAFLPLWTLAVAATVSAFVVHLALRGKKVQLGYELGRARQEQARLREVKHVLELEAASNKTPERIELVARTLLGMEPPAPDRIIAIATLQRSEDVSQLPDSMIHPVHERSQPQAFRGPSLRLWARDSPNPEAEPP
jgi:cell division protein FtsL